jgi:hypothetical protein
MTYHIFLKIELMGPLNVHVAFHLFHILIKIYLACKVKIGLKKKILNQFQTYLLLTFTILKLFKFYNHLP